MILLQNLATLIGLLSIAVIWWDAANGFAISDYLIKGE